ncbi:carboxypeptidase-like regulatory domain-containing protein [Candidatus Neomarinimicrobiota bacterium]
MKKISVLSITLLVMLHVSPAFAQVVEVEGLVTNQATGDAMPGANVFIEGTDVGTMSDDNGYVTLPYVTDAEFTVVVQYMGFKTLKRQFVPGDNLSDVKFELIEDVFEGETVVVTGLASRRSKETSEVAVSRVRAAELTEIQSYQDLSQLVGGKIAGVRVETSSGNVGSGIRFNMRSGGGLNGNEQPVIYVDGIRMNNDEYEGTGVGGQGISMLADLNPEDIASIDILKGPAAAASYGTNGSNGVVLITTKRGQTKPGTGRGATISYKYLTGTNSQAYEFDDDDYVNADMINGIHHDGAITQTNLSASGGTDVFKYYLGVDRRYEEGILINNHMDRRTFRANFDVIASDKLNLSANTTFTLNENRRPEGDNNSYSWIGQTYKDNPPYPSIDSLAITKINNTINTNRFMTSVSARWHPFKGLEVGGSVGVDNYDLIDTEHYPFGYYISGHDEGHRSVLDRYNSQFTYQGDAQYNYDLSNALHVTSVVGAQVFDRRVRTSSTSKERWLTSLVTDVGAGSEYTGGSENQAHWREAGIFTEHSLALDDQYFMSFMVRKDYASTVGLEAPSIIYPRASVAVRLDKYDFFPVMFNIMKLRVAYGETGVLPGRAESVRLLWEGDASAYGVGATIDQIGNDKLEPERIKEIEFGLDAEILNNYSVELTYYRQYAEESIVGVPQAPSTGRTSNDIPMNIGGVEGWGIESLIQARPISSRNFQLDLSLTNNYQTNEITDMGGLENMVLHSYGNVFREGTEKHAFWAASLLGAKFDADGAYDGAEYDSVLTLQGTPLPPYTGSFSINARVFKNFTINVLTDWATGHTVLNYTRKKASSYSVLERQRELQLQTGYGGGDAFYYAQDGYWHGPEAVEYYNSIEPLTPGTPEYIAAANELAGYDYENVNYYEPADFFKLREISISYRATDLLNMSGRSPFSDVVIGLSARNVWEASKYSGPCSEVNHNGARYSSRGIDFYTLQLPRVVNLWVKFSL